jgi:cytochrome c-type biogenesis protein CcmI
MLWFVLVAMTVLAVLGALWPLVMRRKGGADAASEVAFYKAQLGEIERDVERGLLPAEEAAGARAEAARRLIAASAAAPGATGAGEPWMQRLIAAALVLIFVPLVALALYADLGRPDMPDEPLASRKADATTAEGVEAAVARLEAQLTASPDDGKVWEVIAPVYMRLGRFDDAVNAFREVLKLDGESASRRADYGEALVAAAGGVVTADARAAFDKALAEQPGQIAARFYLGLAAEQDGDKPKAIAAYKGLLSEAPDDAPWAATVKKRLAALEGGAAPSGPASAAPDDAHQKSIREVVEQLAKRLAQSGGDAGQWQQLIRSYAVLNEPDKAREALASARKALAGDAAAGPGLDALARQFGLEGGEAAANAAPPVATVSPAAPAAPATTAATSEAPAASSDDEAKMVRDMVEKLAARLAQSGGDAGQWEQLIRSYVVLNEPDKARDALASARKALAGDAAAGPGLAALAQKLGLEGADAAANAAPPAPTASTPPAAPAAPAADAATDDQQTMIRGMVERLATRLAQSGGDASEWQRLIRAYSVLHEPDKAKDALASARKALSGDAGAGRGLDALAQELGIGG